jgi:ribosome-binding factor A
MTIPPLLTPAELGKKSDRERHGNKTERLERALRDGVAAFLAREANRTSLITITRVEYQKRANRATVQLTVLPEHALPAVLDYLHRREHDLRMFLDTQIKIGRLPHFHFILDIGEKNRQRIDQLSTGA